MAAQTMWSGTISFSLVAIPVHLVKAIDVGRISFHLLHSKDYSPLQRKMICPVENAIVPPDEIVRGFEIAPDKFILMSDEELESVSPERSRTIEITEFIDMREVDAVYFDHPYYLVPAKGGEKAYQLLVEVMRRTNKAGIARFVLSEREYPVAVFSKDGALAVMILHYRDEVRPEEFISKAAPLSAAAERRMRKSIEQMTVDFEPAKYADERRNRIRALIVKKAREQTPVEAPASVSEEGEGPADLIAALEESMRKVKESR
jgi:DNA end-binding protein Ku